MNNKYILLILLFTLILTFLSIKVFDLNILQHQFEIFFMLLVINGIIFYQIKKDRKDDIVNIVENNLIKYGVIILIFVFIIQYLITVLSHGITTQFGLLLFCILIFSLIIIYSVYSIMQDYNKLI